jgi:hypothetical protein
MKRPCRRPGNIYPHTHLLSVASKIYHRGRVYFLAATRHSCLSNGWPNAGSARGGLLEPVIAMLSAGWSNRASPPKHRQSAAKSLSPGPHSTAPDPPAENVNSKPSRKKDRLVRHIYFVTPLSAMARQHQASPLFNGHEGEIPSWNEKTRLRVARSVGAPCVLHVFLREVSFRVVRVKGDVPPARKAYLLLLFTFCFTGCAGLSLHAALYPTFPFGSHIKLAIGYWALGAGIVVQLE